MKARLRSRSLRSLACVLLLASAPARGQTIHPPQKDLLGEIDFPHTGSPAAADPFLRGVLLLHSFEYEDAAEAFRAAQAADPDFALAYWGEALTHSHPIWNEDDPEAARAILARLAPTREERRVLAPAGRDRGLLESVEILFGEGTRPERNRAYSAFLEELHERYPDDHEVAAFYSLSLLGTSTNGRDTRTYMRAAAVAEEIYQENPRHPGALHYAIHSYDDPVHAPLGLRMARRYAQVAPAAEHALHMPSHIFVALGMWEESVASNVASAAAADERRERKGLPVEERGLHALAWLAYSYLQLGRFSEAEELLRDMIRDNETAGGPQAGSTRTRYHLVVMRAHHLVALGDWSSPLAELEVSVDELGIAARAVERFVRGCAAARRGDLETAEAERTALLADLGLPLAELGDGPLGCCQLPLADLEEASPRKKAAHVMARQLEALLALARRDADAALEAARAAAELEAAMGFDFGPPVVVKPAHEMLGEMLLSLGRPQEAVPAFEAALDRAPRRARSLLGLARALDQSGREDRARAVFAVLAGIWHRADGDLPTLDAVRRGAGSRPSNGL